MLHLLAALLLDPGPGCLNTNLHTQKTMEIKSLGIIPFIRKTSIDCGRHGHLMSLWNDVLLTLDYNAERRAASMRSIEDSDCEMVRSPPIVYKHQGRSVHWTYAIQARACA